MVGLVDLNTDPALYQFEFYPAFRA
jgi:hypothetical protein